MVKDYDDPQVFLHPKGPYKNKNEEANPESFQDWLRMVKILRSFKIVRILGWSLTRDKIDEADPESFQDHLRMMRILRYLRTFRILDDLRQFKTNPRSYEIQNQIPSVLWQSYVIRPRLRVSGPFSRFLQEMLTNFTDFLVMISLFSLISIRLFAQVWHVP